MAGDRQTVAGRLRAAGCVFDDEEAQLLIAAAGDPADLESMVERRVAGQRLERILGWADFAGQRIMIDPGVFIPRPRTEFLAETAISLVKPRDVVVFTTHYPKTFAAESASSWRTRPTFRRVRSTLCLPRLAFRSHGSLSTVARTGSTSYGVAEGAPAWLAPAGHLLVETSERQAAPAAVAFKDAGLSARATRSEKLDAIVVIGTCGPG